MLARLEAVVREAGTKLLAMRGSSATEGVWEGSQLKTIADNEMHRHLVSVLRGLGLEIPVISEEDAASQSGRRPARYWLIDPIDGTASFAGGFAGFVTQAALMEDGIPVLAAINAPVFGLTYCAQRGGGATLNGSKIRVDGDLQRKILIDNYPQPRGAAALLYESVGCTGYVESGSIALKICRIADGTADLFFKAVAVRDWDIAPAHLLLAEAGGCLRPLAGKEFLYDGDFEKNGLVAARTAALAQEAITAHLQLSGGIVKGG